MEQALSALEIADNRDGVYSWRPEIDALRAALAEPAVEPVAWTWDTPAHHFGKGVMSAHFQFDKPEFEGGMMNLRPLYESPQPPAEVPLLSDFEISDIFQQSNKPGSSHGEFARDIEQAVRRKAGLP